MVKSTLEGSRAAAQAVRNCSPDVVACYPITPSTHIAEDLDKMYANGEIKKFIAVEAEFSAISALIGASATGGRAFSTTSSQGLALMHEALHAAAGMRFPMVMVVANRSLSAPLSIWNDHQDSISQRDTGWIQLYCESNQEVADSVPQAFKISEETYLPAMVCMDGFYLTHAVEQIDVPSKELIEKFLPHFKPEYKLDPENPVSMGAYAMPADYQSFREDLAKDVKESAEVIERVGKEWSELTGREYGLLDAYKVEDAERVFVGMGSVMGNAKEAVDLMREKGEKVGALRIRSYRPFPHEKVKKLLEGKKVAVFEKDVSFGGAPPVQSEVAYALFHEECVLSTFTGGLGGRDVTVEHVKQMLEKIKDGKVHGEWV